MGDMLTVIEILTPANVAVSHMYVTIKTKLDYPAVPKCVPRGFAVVANAFPPPPQH